MIRIRGGSGLGDSIYLRPVVDHFIRCGESVTVNSNHPEVFIGSCAKVMPFSRDAGVIAHYAGDRGKARTTQFEDLCLRAGVGKIPYRMDWTVRNPGFVDVLRAQAAGRPLVLAHGGREPFGRSDGLGLPLIPEQRVFDNVLAQLSDCFTVGIGKAPQIYPVKVDSELNGNTSVSDLLDLGKSCDAVVAQVSFCVPLAEIFDKPFLGVWAAKGLTVGGSTPGRVVIRQITPQKVLSKPSSRHVIDNWTREQITEAVRAFRQLF